MASRYRPIVVVDYAAPFNPTLYTAGLCRSSVGTFAQVEGPSQNGTCMGLIETGGRIVNHIVVIQDRCETKTSDMMLLYMIKVVDVHLTRSILLLSS